MNISSALQFATKQLKQQQITSPLLDAEILLVFILKKPKEFLYTYPEHKLSSIQTEKYKKIISRRAKYEPVAYLIGNQEFYSLNFVVNKNVLIPRPETELLVDEIINYIKSYKPYAIGHKLVIADIGTGSGAISITLKKQLPKCKIIATDVSRRALTVAQKNAQLNKVKINFLYSNLLKSKKIPKNIDIIITNLPYVDEKEKNIKQSDPNYKKTLKYEPASALYGGKFGLEFYEKMFEQINTMGYNPKAIFCEIGHTHLDKTKKLVQKYFPNKKFTIKKDLCGKNRVLVIKT